MKFTEAQLEAAIIELLGEQGYPYTSGTELSRDPEEVIIEGDLRGYLASRYAQDDITSNEIDTIIKKLENLPTSDLYESNKTFCKWLSDGFLLKREAASKPGEPSKKDLYIQLIDYDDVVDGHNIFKIVNQLEIDSPSADNSKRIPDGILYINGLPVVVFEFKSAIREEQASIHDAYVQLTTRYRRDIPQLFVFNALCVISDGVNNKMGNVFAPYDFYYAWRKVTGDESIEQDGINALHTMLQGLFDKERLCDVIRNFIYFPDKSKGEVKIVCRYPQYYRSKKAFR